MSRVFTEDVAFRLGVLPPLDSSFRPAHVVNRLYRERVVRAEDRVPFLMGIERGEGNVSRARLEILPEVPGENPQTFEYVERTIKFLLWARGGWRLYVAGPRALCERLRRTYCPEGERAFDVELMSRVFDRPFEVCMGAADDIPPARESTTRLGGHLDGCRVGFDLGASDYKLAAVQDGEVVFSAEIPWHPVGQSDPEYHYRHLRDGLRLAARHLPHVDAIGGSAAGIYMDNEPRVASLFRSLSNRDFDRRVRTLFHDLQSEWGVPLVVANDGDVTALAGGMSLGAKGVLGMAMGSSEAVGFLDLQGRLTGWLNELAFAPVDLGPDAAVDEWSGDYGVGAMYFSQQAVNRLAAVAGMAFPAEMELPERLKDVQRGVERGDTRAARIFETIGVYLGHTLPYYGEHYDARHVLLLGRVMSGRGGELILEQARRVLDRVYPGIGETMRLMVPDERSRRVGQAVAAASLPSRS